MPSKIDRELQSLVDALVGKALPALENGQPCIHAAGTTRLGKTETLPLASIATKLEAQRRKLEDSILIRVRRRQYASVAILEPVLTESAVRIHAEKENGMALSIRIPFRQKRPGRISFGEPTIAQARVRWYASE